MKPYACTDGGPLLTMLMKAYPAVKRTKLKQLLKYGAVTVNGKAAERHDQALKAGDVLAVKAYRAEYRRAEVESALSFPIVYEDERLIVIDKPAGLLTMGSETEKVRTAYFELTAYARAKSLDGKGRIFIVHRLDRDSSGLLVFAKDEATKNTLQKNWDKVDKKYFAVVEGRPPKESDNIESYLAENKSRKVFSTHASKLSKLAITFYKVLASNKKYSMLEVTLVTGRKNQIRVQLSDIGHPIIGDEKYGATSDPARRLGLHSHSLSFNDPDTGERMSFTSPLPEELELKNLR